MIHLLVHQQTSFCQLATFIGFKLFSQYIGIVYWYIFKQFFFYFNSDAIYWI